MASYHINEEIAPIWGNLSPITYILYQDICLVNQCHSLQSIRWTDHQRVMEHISKGY